MAESKEKKQSDEKDNIKTKMFNLGASEIIVDRLYLGGACYLYDTLIDIKNNFLGIGVIINVADNVCMNPDLLRRLEEHKIKYYHFNIPETYEFNITTPCKYIAQVIHKHMQENKKIFVHCMAGLNRSPCAIISYLILHQNRTFEEACGMVLLKRPHIKPQTNYIWHIIKMTNEHFKNKNMKIVTINDWIFLNLQLKYNIDYTNTFIDPSLFSMAKYDIQEIAKELTRQKMCYITVG